MCADIELLNGQVLDCGGQCSNGGTCLNGECNCRKGFAGKFCEIVEYVPDKTNYTLYLQYTLFYIIMLIIILALIMGAIEAFKRADKIKEKIATFKLPEKKAAPPPPPQEEEKEEGPLIENDPDALGGDALPEER